MSASSKKKLRKEQRAAELTEKQRKEQIEAKKLKVSSTVFVVVMVAILLTAIVVMAVSGVRSSGIIEKNTVALTVNDHQINSIHMNYYYTDIVNTTYSEWSSMYGDYTDYYLSMMGLDSTVALDQQPYYDDETTTWGDYFMDQAITQATADYALYDLAMDANYTLSEDDTVDIDSNIGMVEMYAMLYGYDTDDYLELYYGNGASEKSLREYLEISAIASAYYTDHQDSLVYDDSAIRAYEADKYQNYNSYSYSSYYLSRSSYLSEEEAADPSDAALDVAIAAAEADAKALLTATTEDALNAAIAALPVNAETAAQLTRYDNNLYPQVNSAVQSWVADEARVPGEITMIPSEGTATNDAGEEENVILGYYIVMFHGFSDNTQPMSNVRHLLVTFEGGTTDDSGNTVYTDDAKAAAKAEAEGYLAAWQSGEATEESFIALVQEHSDDSSASSGGLFEDIHPDSPYVENFLNWSIDAARQAGDTGVIETEYGYHVMYYVGNDELSYRDYMICEELRTADMETWYGAIVDAVTVTNGDLKHVNTNLILNPGV